MTNCGCSAVSFVFTGDAQITVTGEKGEETIVRAKGDTLILNRTRSGRVGFHPKFKAVHKAPLRRSDSGATHLRLLIDTSSIEVFANRGETVITDLILPTAGKQTLSINTDVRSARVSKLKSAW